MKKKSLKQRLDSLAKEGKEVRVTWEGGNDSGGFTVFVDGDQLEWNDDFGDEIISQIEYNIDYGSWAGEFYADGEVWYNHEEGAFVGSGKDVTTDHFNQNCYPIEVRVPNILNFDRINIDVEGNPSDEDASCNVSFHIENGPVFEEHLLYQKKIEDKVLSCIMDFVRSVDTSDGGSVNSVYNDWIIRREDMDEDGEDLCFYITELSYGYDSPSYKDYSILVRDDNQ